MEVATHRGEVAGTKLHSLDLYGYVCGASRAGITWFREYIRLAITSFLRTKQIGAVLTS